MAVLSRKPTASPQISPETKPFWEAASAGKLFVKDCEDCQRVHYYPRTICPHCFGERTQWRESAGLGSIYSFTVMRREKEPYALAYVTLDEGVTLMTNIVGCEPDSIFVGQRVRVRFVATPEGPPVAMFEPDPASETRP
jgi:uncharacterized OB-fold protein